MLINMLVGSMHTVFHNDLKMSKLQPQSHHYENDINFVMCEATFVQ